ncbi:MAG: ABC transporter transmembrane domain-containing protein, partial [Rhodococcus sp. (in: high G+C Gram-positive bacteria)]|uniref:ABC transporter transmembrane domain-containing protein n=1 Tax=Rhodococcus sp. TaxID=1831 RepID=UPI003D9B88B5
MTGPAARHAATAPIQKPRSFGPSVKRLMHRLVSYRGFVVTVLLATVGSVILSAIAPRVLGHATDLIFNGVVGRMLPAGATKDEAVDGLRAQGQDTFADMVASMDLTPGVGVDFSAVGRVLMIVLGLYLGTALLSWIGAYLLNIVVVGTIRRLRSDVEAKLHRLPLRYYDTMPRGDLLSRVT